MRFTAGSEPLNTLPGYDTIQLSIALDALPHLADPVAVFAQLGNEVRAAEVLVSLSTTAGETRRAALAGLYAVRVALEDARDTLDLAAGLVTTEGDTPA